MNNPRIINGLTEGKSNQPNFQNKINKHMTFLSIWRSQFSWGGMGGGGGGVLVFIIVSHFRNT